MTFIIQPTKEGETSKCPTCDIDLIGRWSDYKGRFADKLQWQTIEPRKAHYDKDGNCKGETPEQAENAASETVFSPPTLELLDPSTKKLISNEAEFICHIRQEVLTTAKKYEVDPNLGTIWEMTALIWKKYFGAAEAKDFGEPEK